MVDWDWEFSIFVSLCLIRPKTEIITSKYLECYLNSNNAYQQAIAHSKAGVITNLHLVEIKSFDIPVPSLEEQHQIVAEIEKEETMVESAKQLIEVFEKKIKDKIDEVR